MIENLSFDGKRDDKYGLGLILSDKELDICLMITDNKIISESLKLTLENYKKGKIYGIIVNSGNANCFVKNGFEDAKKICEMVSKKYGFNYDNYLIFSTGIIGKRIDLNRIEKLLERIKPGKDMRNIYEFANAIRTTDKKPKVSIREGKGFKFLSIAKGSGMISPSLKEATLLCFVITNAYNEKMKEIFGRCIKRTINLISIDNDKSTNDAVALISTRNVYISEELFEKYLMEILDETCKKIVEDGEGATKTVEIIVKNAKSHEDAEKIIKSISKSYLIKTMIFGSNPNLGRIIAAIGYSGATFDENSIEMKINGIKAMENGSILEKNLKNIRRELIKDRILIEIDLKIGDACLKGYTCDLSYNYIRINAFEYT